MSQSIIEFKEDMTLRQRFREYSKFVLDGGYVVDDTTRNELIKFFDTFENSNRGVIIYGLPGTGKTMLFQILDRVIHPQDKLKFRFRAINDIVSDFSTNGHEALMRDKLLNIMFDDLGAEDKGIHFGDRVEVMERMIEKRYNIWHDFGVRTFLTTNYNEMEIEKRYGSRVIGRIREMCVPIIFKRPDMRSKKNFKQFPIVYHKTIVSEEEKQFAENYKRHRDEMSARPQPERVGMGERLRREIMGEYGTIIASTSLRETQKAGKRKRKK